MSPYAIVKVDVIERNDVTERHGIVITRTSAVDVAALSKNRFSEMKGTQEKEYIIGVRDR